MTVTGGAGGAAGALSKQVAPDDQPRDGRGGLKLITMFSYLVSVCLIGEVMSRERERKVTVVLLALACWSTFSGWTLSNCVY